MAPGRTPGTTPPIHYQTDPDQRLQCVIMTLIIFEIKHQTLLLQLCWIPHYNVPQVTLGPLKINTYFILNVVFTGEFVSKKLGNKDARCTVKWRYLMKGNAASLPLEWAWKYWSITFPGLRYSLSGLRIMTN